MTYIITMPGYMWSTDGITRLRVAEQLAAGNGWHLEPGSIYEGWTVQGPDGKAYSFYGLGISLVYVPFVVAARTIADGGGLPEAAAIEFVASLVNPLLGALLCAMFFLLLLNLAYTPRIALITTIGLGFGTVLWAHTRDNYDHVMAATCLFASLLLLVRVSTTTFSPYHIAAGACAGLAFLTRIDSAIFILGLLLYIVGTTPPEAYRYRRAVYRIVSFGVGAVPFLILFGAYNYLRFGSVLETGYGIIFDATDRAFFGANSLATGAYRYLYSPGRGMFLYAPIVLLGIVGIVLFWRRERILARIIGVVACGWLLFYFQSNAISPWGWGPRQLIPIIPLLLIPAAEIFARVRTQPRWQVPVYGLLLLSICMQLPVALTSPSKPMLVAITQEQADMTFDWRYTQLLLQVRHVRTAIPATVRGDEYVFDISSAGANPEYLANKITLNIVDVWWILLYFYGFRWALAIGPILIVMSILLWRHLWRMTAPPSTLQEQS